MGIQTMLSTFIFLFLEMTVATSHRYAHPWSFLQNPAAVLDSPQNHKRSLLFRTQYQDKGNDKDDLDHQYCRIWMKSCLKFDTKRNSETYLESMKHFNSPITF